MILPPFDQIAELWDEMPLRQRRAFIARVVRRVKIGPALRKGYAKRGEEDKRIREWVVDTSSSGAQKRSTPGLGRLHPSLTRRRIDRMPPHGRSWATGS
jgi:hypothetical protein